MDFIFSNRSLQILPVTFSQFAPPPHLNLSFSRLYHFVSTETYLKLHLCGNKNTMVQLTTPVFLIVPSGSYQFAPLPHLNLSFSRLYQFVSIETYLKLNLCGNKNQMFYLTTLEFLIETFGSYCARPAQTEATSSPPPHPRHPRRRETDAAAH